MLLTKIVSQNLSGYTVRRMAHVGVIGIGNMGTHMAKNLLKNGHELSIYDVQAQVLNKLASPKVKICSSPKEVAKQADIIVTMLPNNIIVYNTYTGPNGILQGASPKKILVDSSTIAPAMAKKIAGICNEAQIEFMDAPVSGGVVGAANQTLTFMVGGKPANVKKIENVLLSMGKRVVHCGDIGSGQVAKICNNMLLAITMIGVSEALNLGQRLGLDAKLLTDIINTSTGRCWSSEINNPVPNVLANVPASDDYKGGFSTKLILKDLGLAQNAAHEADSVIFMGGLAHQIYSTMEKNGFGDKDFASVYQFIKAKQ